MTAQVVSMSFPAGTAPNIVQTQFAQAVFRSVFQQRGIDTSKMVFNASPAIMQTTQAAVLASPPIAQAAVAAAAGGPITVSANVDGVTGAVTPSSTLSKTHIAVGNEVLDPTFVMPTSPPAMKNPPGAPPLKADPVTGQTHDLVGMYGNAANDVVFGSTGLLASLGKVGGLAAGAVIGTLAGGPVGLIIGAAAGGGLDYLRAQASKKA